MDTSPQFEEAADTAASGAYWHPQETLGLLRPIEAVIAAVIHQSAPVDFGEAGSRSSFVAAVDEALIARHPQAALAPSALRHALIARVARSQPRRRATVEELPRPEGGTGGNGEGAGMGDE